MRPSRWLMGQASEREKRLDALHRAIERRGCVVERFGSAWRVYGRDVDILAVDLADIAPAELRPPRRVEVQP